MAKPKELVPYIECFRKYVESGITPALWKAFLANILCDIRVIPPDSRLRALELLKSIHNISNHLKMDSEEFKIRAV
jgi:hypothetical protein